MKALIINDRGVYEQETYKLTPYGVTLEVALNDDIKTNHTT